MAGHLDRGLRTRRQAQHRVNPVLRQGRKRSAWAKGAIGSDHQAHLPPGLALSKDPECAEGSDLRACVANRCTS